MVKERLRRMAAIGEDVAQTQDGHRVPAEKARGGLGSQDLDDLARGVDENAAVDVGGTWWASRTRPARWTQRTAGEASLDGGREVAAAEARGWRRDMRRNRRMGGDNMRQPAKVDRGPGSRREGRERGKQYSLGSAWGDVCAGRQELVSSIDERGTTDGVVDERAGCCATRCLTIWQRDVEESKGVGMTYLSKRAPCRAFRGGLSSIEPIAEVIRWGLRDRGLMALKMRSRSQSVGKDDSPEDMLGEKYHGADGVREVDPSERYQGGGRERRRP
ncbi:hypothetical protein B0H14DRAFT_2643107 [Mycena olivaceomarginata]|nr:hypothetical protein B0H14DRAFT_2643107 [Mycena olivaceomarginata]